MTTEELLRTAWDPGNGAWLCVVALSAYALRYRGRVRHGAALFVLATALFFIAVASPIGTLARGYLFSAHMLQHLLLMLAVPPLVLLGLPPPAVPSPLRGIRAQGPEGDGGEARRAGLETLARWTAGVGGMWLWHAPALCNAAAASSVVQSIQTASLVVMGLGFWWPILAPASSDRLSTFPAIGYLFAACSACTILGIMVTLSPVEVCTAYMHPVDSLGVMPLLRDRWGLTHKADQELGGLMMWVPACLVYATAIMATLGRYYADERPRARVEEAR